MMWEINPNTNVLMRNKKICFIVTVPITVKSFLLGFTKYLIEKENYDVTFICNFDESLNKMCCNEHLHFIPVTMKRGLGLDGISVIRRLTRIFKEQKFDIVQYSTPNASLYASIAASLAKAPCRLYCQWGVRYMGFSGAIRCVFKCIEKLICLKSTVIEVESFSLYDFGMKESLYPKGKASVIWNGSACGVNMAKFDYTKRQEFRSKIRTRLGIAAEDVVFGYAGRITRDKGINELVEAFVGANGNEKAKLLLIGDFDNSGTIRPDIMNTIENSENIKHIGWVKDVEQYYAAMDVFCSLSYREGFGLVVIEAGAMATAGIVSNVPGQVDTIIDGKTGLLVDVKSVGSIRKAMETFILNPSLTTKMGVNARVYVADNYDDAVLFAKLAEHRNQIISAL